jgi:hypothetical protein
MQGKKKARVHETFSNRVKELRAGAKKLAESLQGGDEQQRVWDIPEALADKDLTDVPNLHDPAFDRNEMNANYDETMADAASPGTVGDVMGLKVQIDYVAAEERAFRLRHATSTRCIVVAHGRLAGHGHDKGIFTAAENLVGDHILAGALGESGGALENAVPDMTQANIDAGSTA